jgi:mercuric reductase
VYVAAAQGSQAADNAFGRPPQTIDYAAVPRVTFTSPAIAAVGLGEQQAQEQGLSTQTRVLPLEYVPRAIVNRDTSGLVKLVAETGTGRLLGAHVAAENAGEIIAAAVYALSAQMTVAQLADTWSPYLTMSEALKLTAQTFTQDVTKLSCCAH